MLPLWRTSTCYIGMTRSFNILIPRFIGTCQRLQNSNIDAAHGSLPSAVKFDNYEAEVNSFKLHVPKSFNFAKDVIDNWALHEKHGLVRNNNPAFWWFDEATQTEIQWSFQDIARLSKRTAMLLQKLCGVNTNDRVLVILPRVSEWWLINIACLRIGAILIPGTTQLTIRDIQSRIAQAKITTLITDNNVADSIQHSGIDFPSLKSKILVSSTGKTRAGWHDFESLFKESTEEFQAVENAADDLMTIFFTSGTTGHPKMTAHTHASYGLASLITGRYWLDLVPTDVHWNLSDTGWAKSAWSNLFAPWIQGACVFVYNAPGFVPRDILKVLQKYPVSTFCTAPTAYRMMVQCDELKNFQSKTLRHTVSAGEPLNPEVIEKWFRHTGLQIREGYGQTETVLQAASFRCLENRPGSMGKPAPGMALKVIDENCNVLPPGKEGDLAIRVRPHKPVGMFVGYIDDPQQTEAAFRGDYYLTGDRAYADADGYLWFVGRADDVILSSGYRIGPFEVESALIEHPAVAESAVVSSPDPTRGEVVKAFIVLTNLYKQSNYDVLIKELQEHVKATTAPYKYPRKIEFVDALPKTVSGKIRRVELRRKEWER